MDSLSFSLAHSVEIIVLVSKRVDPFGIKAIGRAAKYLEIPQKI